MNDLTGLLAFLAAAAGATMVADVAIWLIL